MLRILTFILASVLVARAQTTLQGQLVVAGDRQTVDQATGVATLSGNVRVTDDTVQLTADEVLYDSDPRRETITARGNIVFTRGDVRLLADRLTYHRLTQAFEADNIRLGRHPYFVEGFSASGTKDEITVKRARASYGEPGPWQPTINADTIVFTSNDQIRTENVTLGIGHAQPVPIPKFSHSLNAPLVGTASFSGGYRRSLGVFADTALHVPVRPGLRLGADLGVFTNRGVMVGPSGRYEDPKNPAALRGYFRSGYINDHGEKGRDILERPIPEDRAYAEWQHQQILAPNLTLMAQLNWWKDSEVLRDFRSRAFFPVQQPDTFVESVYAGENYFLTAFARFQPNRFHHVQERLPEIRFDVLPLALGNGFYHRFNASAAVLREDPLPGSSSAALPRAPGAPATTVRSNRLDGYYSMLRPFAPREWFAFTPVAGGRVTHYANTRGVARTGSYTRVLGEFGADALLRGSGTFDYKNPQWKIDGLRHLVTPRLSYRYIPEWDRGRRAVIPEIDRRARLLETDYLPYLQPLGLGDMRNIDDIRPMNTLRFGIDNVLQTRDANEGTRDLLALNVATDFRFKRLPSERDMSEVHAELAVMPTHWLQFDLYQSVRPQGFTLRELNSGVTVRDGNVWSLRFGNNFLRDQIQDYSIDGRVRLNERFEALTRLHYDARRHRFNEQSYGIAQNLGNTWLVSYTVRLYSGRRRESSFGFNIEIEAVQF